MGSLDPRMQDLLDRQAILDCLNRYCMGVDRHDSELLISAFHADAVDEHGPFVGGPVALAAWLEQFHSENFSSHSHAITSHRCEIDGDTAHAQTYCLYGLRRKDEKSVAFGCARYVDRLERRQGEWRIALRKVFIEWRGEMPAHLPAGYPQGPQDRSDPSYQRPLVRAAAASGA